jgi:hypothetical protein
MGLFSSASRSLASSEPLNPLQKISIREEWGTAILVMTLTILTAVITPISLAQCPILCRNSTMLMQQVQSPDLRVYGTPQKQIYEQGEQSDGSEFTRQLSHPSLAHSSTQSKEMEWKSCCWVGFRLIWVLFFVQFLSLPQAWISGSEEAMVTH